MTTSRLTRIITCLCMGALLVNCSGLKPKTETVFPKSKEDERREKRGKLFGEEGLVLFGGDKKGNNTGGGTGVGVNTHLWRASLETLSFLPLQSVDPHGGVIITDWYSDPGQPNERIRVNVLILDTVLRVDALKLSVFKQERKNGGEWADVNVSTNTTTSLEDKILIRARELRIKQANG